MARRRSRKAPRIRKNPKRRAAARSRKRDSHGRFVKGGTKRRAVKRRKHGRR